MAMGLMLCMFVLFLVFSAIGLYMMFKSSFMVTTDNHEDIPPDI